MKNKQLKVLLTTLMVLLIAYVNFGRTSSLGTPSDFTFFPKSDTIYTIGVPSVQTDTAISDIVNSEFELPCLITGNLSLCAGQSTQLCVPSVLGETYLWSTGATTNCITVSAAGNYAVTITTALGSVSTCSATVTVGLQGSCLITGNLSILVGQSTQLCVPSVVGSTYLWSTGATTNCITVSAAGNYSVTVSNVSGCVSTCSVIVTGTNTDICCNSFINTFLNANFTYTNVGSVYTFTKPAGTLNGDILTWTFGDGQAAMGMSPIVHTYPSVSGSYLATLYIQRPQANGDTCKVKLSALINTNPCPNLIRNGDFSLGDTGFTSGLLAGCTAASNCNTGYYCVSNNFTNKCNSWPSVFDHTFGNTTGSFMSIDGTTTAAGATEVWRNAAIPVSPNTTYKFSFWLNSVYSTLPVGQSLNLDMFIDGNGSTANPTPIIITPVITQATLGSNSTWKQYSTLWVCPSGVTTVDLAIRQASSGAFRDFGLDDISFTCVSCEDFMTDVMNFGIKSTLVSGTTYKYCVSPNISSSDIVQWDLDCNGSVDATTNSTCQNFTLSGANNQICATVLHINKPGDTCRVKVNTCLPSVSPSPVKEVTMPILNVKPNPTTQSVLVTLPEGIQNIVGFLKLSTIEGRILKSIPVRSTEIYMELDVLPAGLYFITFYDDKGIMLTQPTKLVKQ